MKIKYLILGVLLVSAAHSSGQSKVGAIINLNDGKSIDVYHFGRLSCESNKFAETFTILRGRYFDSPTEINNYSDVAQLILSGFTDAPAASVGNQKGQITAIKRDGVKVELEEAELSMSCFGPGDRYNQIRVQIMNPLTESPVDLAIEMRNIESITFK